MTDTDKIKRLAGDRRMDIAPSIREAILALIAENERLKDYLEASEAIVQRQASQLQHIDEAVALLRANMMYPDDGKTVRETQAFLARIDEKS